MLKIDRDDIAMVNDAVIGATCPRLTQLALREVFHVSYDYGQEMASASAPVLQRLEAVEVSTLPGVRLTDAVSRLLFGHCRAIRRLVFRRCDSIGDAWLAQLWTVRRVFLLFFPVISSYCSMHQIGWIFTTNDPQRHLA